MKCQIKNESGVVCPKSFKSAYFQRQHAERHLEQEHKMSEPKGSNSQPKLDKWTSSFSRDRERSDGITDAEFSWANVFARYSLPFRLANDEMFRKLISTQTECPERHRLSSLMPKVSQQCIDMALQEFQSPTLCLDIGTIQGRRFLVLGLLERGYCAILKCIPDVSLGDQRMTAENMRPEIIKLVKWLRTKSVTVVNLVADNASNFRALEVSESDVEGEEEDSEDDSSVLDEEEEEGQLEEVSEAESEEDQVVYERVSLENIKLPYILRCSAHCLQLAVSDIQETVWGTCFNDAMKLANLPEAKSFPKPNDTRWNSKYRFMDAVQKSGLAEDTLRDELRHVCEILQPFQIATDFVQRDDCTLLENLTAWCWLKKHLESQVPEGSSVFAVAMRSNYQHAINAVNKRARFMLTEPYMLLAFFANVIESELKHETKIASIIEHYDPHALLEYESLLKRPAEDMAQTITADELFASLSNVPMASLRSLLISVAQAAPTEACIERAFSTMRRGLTYIRNRLKDDTVEAQLIVASFQSKSSMETSPNPRKPHRKEINVDIVIDQTVDIAPLLRMALEHVEALQPATSEETIGARTRRKKTLLVCCKCGKLVDDHPHQPLKWYLKCRTCPMVINILCAKMRVHRSPESVPVTSDARLYVGEEFYWSCSKCGKK